MADGFEPGNSGVPLSDEVTRHVEDRTLLMDVDWWQQVTKALDEYRATKSHESFEVLLGAAALVGRQQELRDQIASLETLFQL